MASFLEFNKLF